MSLLLILRKEVAKTLIPTIVSVSNYVDTTSDATTTTTTTDANKEAVEVQVSLYPHFYVFKYNIF